MNNNKFEKKEDIVYLWIVCILPIGFFTMLLFNPFYGVLLITVIIALAGLACIYKWIKILFFSSSFGSERCRLHRKNNFMCAPLH